MKAGGASHGTEAVGDVRRQRCSVIFRYRECIVLKICARTHIENQI